MTLQSPIADEKYHNTLAAAALFSLQSLANYCPQPDSSISSGLAIFT